MHAPRDRWLLWASGDGFGPAILFYPTPAFLLIASWVLSRLPYVPLRWSQWFLLGLGLTQVEIEGAFIVAAWFFWWARGLTYCASFAIRLRSTSLSCSCSAGALPRCRRCLGGAQWARRRP